MGKSQYNMGTFLIHNQPEIHDEQEQANIFSETWANIMCKEISNNPFLDYENIINWLNVKLIYFLYGN